MSIYQDYLPRNVSRCLGHVMLLVNTRTRKDLFKSKKDSTEISMNCYDATGSFFY